MNVTIREATPSDAEELLSIYAPYVTGTAITFEYDVPTVDEFRRRISSTLGHFPYIVAVNEADGSLVGYAYASKFKERAAYQFACETSIYLRQDVRGVVSALCFSMNLKVGSWLKASKASVPV